MKKRVALYLRVSTDTQDTDNQRLKLEKVAELREWEIVKVYEDHAKSGTKGRDKRPDFDQMWKDAASGNFNMVAAWSLDRLGRSLQHLVNFMADMSELKVDLYLDQQSIDTSTPSGKAMLQMCGVFAEYERSFIQERVKAGLDRARASGKKLGRPKISLDKERKIKRLLASGGSIAGTARAVGVGHGTVQRIKAKLAA